MPDGTYIIIIQSNCVIYTIYYYYVPFQESILLLIQEYVIVCSLIFVAMYYVEHISVSFLYESLFRTTRVFHL